MKKLFIIITLIFTIFVSQTLALGIPVIDVAAILAEGIGFVNEFNKWKTYIKKFDEFKDGFSKRLGSFLIKSAGLKPSDISELTENIQDVLNIYETSSYFLDKTGKEIWRDLLIELKSIKYRYPSLQDDYITRHKDNVYYQENQEFKSFIDENRRIYKEERLPNIEQRLKLYSDTRKMGDTRKNRIKKFYELYKKFSKTIKSKDGSAMQEGKLIALQAQISLEIIYQNRELNLLIRSFLENKLKSETWNLDQNNRYIKLNSNSKKNIENYLEKMK